MSLLHNPSPHELNLRFENQRLREELSKVNIRAGQLAVEVMRKSAEASEAKEELERCKLEWRIVADQKGHNPCHAAVSKALKRTIGYTGIYPDPDNVSPEEFAQGCVVYHGDIFGECGVKLVVVKEDKKQKQCL
ncbi:MAG: hypothetical protein HYZ69_04410 [Candidatus Colwellbacteria bacterium]|nr:hypothetical protein [Candidatus Colwellbacteria bacterium]